MAKIIFAVCGPSAVGKSSLMRSAAQELNAKGTPLTFAVSATTRAPRQDEQYGKHYYFTSPTIFEHWKREGRFLETAKNKHCSYGILFSEIQKPGPIIVDANLSGIAALEAYAKHNAIHMVSILVLPPDQQTLEQRLRDRNDPISEEEIQSRLRNQPGYAHTDLFHYVIVNHRFPQAQRELVRIIRRTINTEKRKGV